MKKKTLFKVIFYNQGQIYEIYANKIEQSDLYGFLIVREITFKPNKGILVDPTEERLKSEFDGVNESYIPIHSIIRIDEVEKEGISKIKDIGKNDNIAYFPSIFTNNHQPPPKDK